VFANLELLCRPTIIEEEGGGENVERRRRKGPPDGRARLRVSVPVEERRKEKGETASSAYHA